MFWESSGERFVSLFFPFWFLLIQWLMIWDDELVEGGGEVTSELGGGEIEVDDSGGKR